MRLLLNVEVKVRYVRYSNGGWNVKLMHVCIVSPTVSRRK